MTPRIGMRAIRKEQLQPRPTVRNLLNALARWFQAVPFRVADDTSSIIRTPPSRKASAERQSLDI
ncbi:hypothetical protein OG949_00175 [Streptomyces scopuliridis]|uniref:Uncharacterized protein n=1 Tax=Streptomyces scopuliridis TaxID=452529 RepID=A0ACD4ZD32_9ACTN|nr:hypothetical protein [Streptomyces scopuliridis]WSB31459.1 hypothetical protein OG949_00175 [Streptomyces scopuliridis]WSB95706.1 hypothetical protein OG835_00755 [Streptomyces scopuliridis]